MDLSWGNRLAATEPTTKQVRTNPLHSDQLAMVVSRWLPPPRTSHGGSRVEGAKQPPLPLVIGTVKKVINHEMGAAVGELKEDPPTVTEQTILGTAIVKEDKAFDKGNQAASLERRRMKTHLMDHINKGLSVVSVEIIERPDFVIREDLFK